MTARNPVTGFRNFLGLYSLVIGGIAVLTIVTAVLVLIFFPELQVAAKTLVAVALVLLLLFVAGAYSEVRSTVLSRQTRYGTNTGLMVAAFLGIAVLINVVSAQGHLRADWTAGAQFTLSRHTQTVLKNLKDQVKVTGFFTKSPQAQAGQGEAGNLLAEYKFQSDKLDYEFVDPEAKPGVARQYDVRDDGTLVFEYQGRRKLLSGIGEQEFTGAILNVTGTEQPRVYVVTGHGEPDIGSSDDRGFSFARDGLATDNYDVQPLNLASANTVPADTALLVVPAPRSPLLPAEYKMLDDYLMAGKKALFMLDPNPSQEFRQLLAKWGVKMIDGTVFDQQSFVPPDNTVPVAQQYDRSDVITKDIAATFFPGAAGLGIQVPQDDQDHVLVSPLAITSPQSFVTSDPSRGQFDPSQDQRGPVPLVLTIIADKPIGQRPQRVNTQPLPGTTAPQINPGAAIGDNPTRIVVFADTDFATNHWFYSLGNSDLFLNSVNWLTGSNELISIRPKPDAARRLVVTQRNWNFILYSSVGLWPLALLVAAGVVWWRRR